jgi:hypothetical protein
VPKYLTLNHLSNHFYQIHSEMYENQNLNTAKVTTNGENKTEEASSRREASGLARFWLALRVWSLSASIIPTILGKF